MTDTPKKQTKKKKAATKRNSKQKSKQKSGKVASGRWEQEETIAMIERMAKSGQPIALIAQILGIDNKTFYRWRQWNPELNARFQKARGEGLGKVIDTAYVMATSGKSEGMTKWYIEKMGSQIVTNIHEETEEKEGNTDEGDENIQRDRIVEALRKDQFLDIKPNEINGPDDAEKESTEVIDVEPVGKGIHDPFTEE